VTSHSERPVTRVLEKSEVAQMRPTIFMRLEPGGGGVCEAALMMKHSDGTNWQTVAEVAFDDDGHLVLRTRDIHDRALCKALGVEPRKGILTSFKVV